MTNSRPSKLEVLRMEEGRFFKKYNERVRRYKPVGVTFRPEEVERILRKAGRLLKKAHEIIDEAQA